MCEKLTNAQILHDIYPQNTSSLNFWGTRHRLHRRRLLEMTVGTRFLFSPSLSLFVPSSSPNFLPHASLLCLPLLSCLFLFTPSLVPTPTTKIQLRGLRIVVISQRGPAAIRAKYFSGTYHVKFDPPTSKTPSQNQTWCKSDDPPRRYRRLNFPRWRLHRHLGFAETGNSAIRSADLENFILEPNTV